MDTPAPTKESLNQEYSQLAAKAGDLFFRVSEAEIALQRMKAQLVEFQKAKRALEAQVANIKDEPAHDGQAPLDVAKS